MNKEFTLTLALKMLSLIALATLTAGCNSSSSGSDDLQGVRSPLVTERDLHDEDRELAFGEFLLLRLESSQPHSGDLGEAGVDIVALRLESSGTRNFRISAADAGLYKVELFSPDGQKVFEIDGSTPSHNQYLEQDVYSLRITRLDDSSLPLAVFFHNGIFSRSCEGCSLSGVNLVRADLSGVSFHRSDLSNGVLTSANCQMTDFSGAILEGAFFAGADCSGSNFQDAEFETLAINGTKFNDTLFDEETQEQLGGLRSSLRFGPPSFGAQDVTVRAGQPFIVGGGSAPSHLVFGTLTLEPGASVEVHGPTQIQVQTLVLQGGGANPNLSFVGGRGSDGGRGADGANGKFLTKSEADASPGDSANGKPGARGGHATDGTDTSSFSLSAAQVSGSGNLEVRVKSGDGGNGGPGGQGGDAGTIDLQIEGLDPQPGSAGIGGNGGDAGGVGDSEPILLYLPEAAVSQVIKSATPGSPGQPGRPGRGGKRQIPNNVGGLSPFADSGQFGQSGRQSGMPIEIDVVPNS